MKNIYNSITVSRWLRFSLLLVLIYSIQISPINHTHHFHKDAFPEFRISSLSLEVSVEHSSNHHHDSDSPQPANHHHAYDKRIDWHIIRTQLSKTTTSQDQCFRPAIHLVPTDDNNAPYNAYEKSPFIAEYNSYFLIIRGSPFTT